MPFYDLNVAYPSDAAGLLRTVAFQRELGYGSIALSKSVTGNLPPTPPLVPLHDLNITSDSNFTILTRLTLTISDTTQNHRLSSLQSHYDILALRPTNEKSFQLCCSSLECEIISLDLTQRLYFPIRFSTVSGALQRGVRFEICYSPGIVGGDDARRNLISNATALIRATRGKGIIVSSEAQSALGIRAPWDVINLAQVWGLSQERGKEAVCEEVGKLVRLARMKRTSYRGVVDIIDGGAGTVDERRAERPDEKKDVAQRKGKAGAQGVPPQKIPAKRPPSTQTQPQPQQQRDRTRGSVEATSRVNSAKSTASRPAGIKRKASNTSLSQAPTATEVNAQSHGKSSSPVNAPKDQNEHIKHVTEKESNQTAREETSQPLSKREMKRRAKKARIESRSGGGAATAPNGSGNTNTKSTQ